MIAKVLAFILLATASFSSVSMVHQSGAQKVKLKSVRLLNQILYPIVQVTVFGSGTSSLYLPGTRVLFFHDEVTFRINTYRGCYYTFLIFSSDGYSNQFQLDVCWHNEGSFITLDPGGEDEE